MRKIRIFLITLLMLGGYSLVAQKVIIVDSIYYGLDETAAKNIIVRANKGSYFDSYVESSQRLLTSVIEAKVRSDSMQIVLKNNYEVCRWELTDLNKYSLKLDKEIINIDGKYQKAKKQRNWSLGIIGILLTIILTY